MAGKLQDRSLRREVDDHLGLLQSGVAAALAGELGVKTAILRVRLVGPAILYAKIVATPEMATDDAAMVLNNMHFGDWVLRNRVELPAIPKDHGRDQDHEIGVLGLTFPIVIPNVYWPKILPAP
jgi:hypothetical protein